MSAPLRNRTIGDASPPPREWELRRDEPEPQGRSVDLVCSRSAFDSVAEKCVRDGLDGSRGRPQPLETGRIDRGDRSAAPLESAHRFAAAQRATGEMNADPD